MRSLRPQCALLRARLADKSKDEAGTIPDLEALVTFSCLLVEERPGLDNQFSVGALGQKFDRSDSVVLHEVTTHEQPSAQL